MNHTIILSLLLVTTIIGNAQSPEQDGRQSDRQKFRPSVERQEGMRALRVAFYEDQLDLSAEESRLFWPVAEAAEEKIKTQGKEIRSAEESLEVANSDADRIELLATINALQHELIDLKGNITNELAQIIGYQKASQLTRIQREFRKIILDLKTEGRKKTTNRYKLRESPWNSENQR